MDADKVLDSLFATLSRGSIAYESAAEELAMSFGSDKFGEVSDAIAEQVGKVPLARRLAYLQCLDLITRKIRERFGCDSDEYKDWTKRLGATLYGFLHKLIPSGNEASESPKVVEQNFKVCKEVVKKWRKSGEFNGAAMLANAEKFLDSCKARVFTRSNSSGRDSKHSGEDSRRKEIDSVLGLSEEEATRYIEAERSKQKRRRFYGSLRQSEADEFWELWGRCETAETPEQLFNAGLGPFCIPRFDERAFSEACGNLHLSKRKHCVFIWSLDDCLILFNSLLNPELYPRIKYADAAEAKQNGTILADALLSLGDKFLSFNKLDKYPISHISEVSSFESFKKAIDSTGQSSDSAEELRQLFLTAFKVYKDGWSNVKKTMSALEVSRYESIQRSIDSFSQDWISQSHLALQAVVYSSGGSNVCIGGGHLIANLSKLLLFDLSEFFDAENIYATESKSDVGKKREFLKILDRFGPHCRYIHLGSGDVDFKDFDEIQKLNPSISLEFHAIERPEDLARLTQRIQEGGFA